MNGLFSPSRHSCRSGSAHALNPVRRNGRAYSLGTSLLHTRNTQARSRTLRYPHDAAHLRHYRSAPVADLVVGWVLSLELHTIVAVGILLLDSHIFDGRFRRSSSPRDVADTGAHREHHGCVDVWSLRKFPVC